MSEEIIKVLDELGKRFGVAIDWTNQNVMPYIQDLMERFIAYRNIQAVLWIIISIAAIGISIWGIKKLIKWRKLEEFNDGYFSDDSMIFGFSLTGIILVIIMFVLVMFCNINGLAQNIFIPELTIINYLKWQL